MLAGIGKINMTDEDWMDPYLQKRKTVSIV